MGQRQPSTNQERIPHPLASNTVRASHTQTQNAVGACVWHVRWQKQQLNSPLGFSSSPLCIMQSYFRMLGEGKCLQLALSWGPAAGKLTVLCSSPSRMRNVCSNTVYMILPIPNEGSITFGMISSTEIQQNEHHHERIYTKEVFTAAAFLLVSSDYT